MSSRKAAMIVGVSFIISVFIVTFIDDFLLANFVVPGDTSVLANDIENDKKTFRLAVVGYLLVLVLDAMIGIGLYVVLKPANKNTSTKNDTTQTMPPKISHIIA